jgi:hypothetical protein
MLHNSILIYTLKEVFTHNFINNDINQLEENFNKHDGI